MIEHNERPPWGGFTVLDSSSSIYRAVLYQRWIKNGVQPGAFIRRDRDRNGISINDPNSCSPRQLCALFRECFGVLRLSVSEIRNLHLDIKPDLHPHHNACDHGNIVGLPLTSADPFHAEFLAGELAKRATLEWQP